MIVLERLTKFVSEYFSLGKQQEPDACGIERGDAVLLTSAVSRQYLLGFHSSAGTLLVLPQVQYFIVDSRYIEQARASITGCEILLQKSLQEQINQLLRHHGVTSCGVEEQEVTLSDFLKLKQRLDPVRILPETGVSRLLQTMRMCKTPDELQFIKQAQGITDQVFAEICPLIHPGITEREIALEIEYRLKKQGADAISFDTIVATGTNSSLPHAHPSDDVVQEGDFITMDFGAVVAGYHADMTRTVAVGGISEQKRTIYQTVLEAQMRALAAMKPGVRCAEIDQIARTSINEAGYEGRFGHGLGHSVGLEIHEEPNFSPNSAHTLEVGMVLTVEPGIYLPGAFGVRIEDMVIITPDGCENITQSPKELISLS